MCVAYATSPRNARWKARKRRLRAKHLLQEALPGPEPLPQSGTGRAVTTRRPGPSAVAGSGRQTSSAINPVHVGPESPCPVQAATTAWTSLPRSRLPQPCPIAPFALSPPGRPARARRPTSHNRRPIALPRLWSRPGPPCRPPAPLQRSPTLCGGGSSPRRAAGAC